MPLRSSRVVNLHMSAALARCYHEPFKPAETQDQRETVTYNRYVMKSVFYFFFFFIP